MRYSSDLRKRVLDFIETGGSKAEASRRFGVSRPTLDKWLKATDPLAYEKPGPRTPTRLDPDALKAHVNAFPDQTLAERADHFQVSTFCIWYGLKRIGCTRKKNTRIQRAMSEKTRHLSPRTRSTPASRQICSLRR